MAISSQNWHVYGLTSVGLTSFLASVLFRNGAVFLRAVPGSVPAPTPPTP